MPTFTDDGGTRLTYASEEETLAFANKVRDAPRFGSGAFPDSLYRIVHSEG